MKLAAVLLALAGACGGEPCPGMGGPDGAAPDAALPTADELFSLSRVHRLDLCVTEADLDALRAQPRVYVPATLVVDGETVDGVGLRLRGTFSFQGLGGKASFKISFDELSPGRTWRGLESLTLGNLRQDHTMVHEWLAYQVFAAAGAPAPRSGFAEVAINDDLYGVYSLVESVDDQLLARFFADPTGNLYEGTLGDDLVPEDLWEFEQDEGSDTSRADLTAFIEAAALPADELFFGEGSPLDTDAFLAFVASEGIAGHWDGYWKSHNYRIYHEPTLDRWTFLPWGADQTWERHIKPFDGTGLLTQKCFTSPRCTAAYAETARAALDAVDALDLEGSMDAAIELTADAVAADPRKPFELDSIAWRREELRAYLRGRRAELEPRLDCAEGGEVLDRDEDGFGDCIDDCEPSSGDAHPGGFEACNGLDDDCDGQVDEPACPCPTVEIGGAEFALCDMPATWSQARAHCGAIGAQLAWVDDAAQEAGLWASAQEARAGWWYVGLNDGPEEGTFAWIDRPEAPVFDGWAPGEPDDWGGEDCGAIPGAADVGWADVRCDLRLPFVCREGEP